MKKKFLIIRNFVVIKRELQQKCVQNITERNLNDAMELKPLYRLKRIVNTFFKEILISNAIFSFNTQPLINGDSRKTVTFKL